MSDAMPETMPEFMKALIVRHDGYSKSPEGPSITTLEPFLEYGDVEVPVPGEGQVLIKVSLGNINPSDLHFIKGEYGQPRRAGIPGGFEGVGVVVAAGSGGEALIGKRVAFYVVVNGSGSWAQYALTHVTSCIPLRKEMRDEDGATLFINPLTAIAMFDEVKKSDTKSFIMTAGASQLCKLLAGLAEEEGMKSIAIVRREEQIEQLKSLGNAHVLNITDNNFTARAVNILREEKPRIMLDAVADQISEQLFGAMPNRARWMIYGKMSPELPTLNQVGQLIFMGKSIEGFWLMNWMKSTPAKQQIEAVAKIQNLFISGKWKTDISSIVDLSAAIEDLPSKLSGMNNGKVMIRP